ncbi:hypothetical protein [Propionicimonas sp. T2.31MG-18]|uniref:hypothetical protein n=1 Tax=Propionicimonas sp. T2.31MG-18 TaxID=3157620 RepID=UPI00366B1A7D
MASVEALLDSLRERTREFMVAQSTSLPFTTDAWALLARNATRVLDLLEGPIELRPILQQLAGAPDGQTRDEDSPLTRVALTLGVLADTLGSRPDVVRSASLMDRSQLRANILASLHFAAEASLARAVPRGQHLAAMLLLRDLAEGTELGSHVPPRPLQGPVSLLRLGPAPGSLDDAISRWASIATEILSSPTRATKYAFQRTAATIARICCTVENDLATYEGQAGGVPHVRAAVLAAFQSWQAAADWPTELRLDGRSGELRQCSKDLEEAMSKGTWCAGPGSLTGLESVLLTASEVGAVHETQLRQRLASGGLWVLADALGPAYLTRHPGTHRSDWLPDPGSHFGWTLTDSARRANSDLRLSIGLLQQLRRADVEGVRALPVWEHVASSPFLSLHRERGLIGPSSVISIDRPGRPPQHGWVPGG